MHKWKNLVSIFTLSVVIYFPAYGEVIDVNPHRLGPIGSTVVYQVLMLEGTIADLGFDLKETGFDQYLDVSGEIDPSAILLETDITVRIVSPEISPFSESFPNANRVIHVSGSDPIIQPESWQHYNVTDDTATLIGVDAVPGVPATVEALGLDSSTWPQRLQMGTEWVFSFKNDNLLLLPDLEVAFESECIFSVDAAGTVVTPAGPFEALRLTKIGTERFTYKDIDLAAMFGSIESDVIEHYWYTIDGLTVIEVRQEISSNETGDIPSTPMLTVSRLLSHDVPLTAVRMESWATIKRYLLDPSDFGKE